MHICCYIWNRYSFNNYTVNYPGRLYSALSGYIFILIWKPLNTLICPFFNSLTCFTGVGMVLRKMGNTVTPTVELKKDGDLYTFTTTSTFKTSSISFKLGEEFDEETLDGRKVKSVCTMDGNTLTQEQKGDKPSTIVREFSDSELITVSSAFTARRLANIEFLIFLDSYHWWHQIRSCIQGYLNLTTWKCPSSESGPLATDFISICFCLSFN